MQAAGAIRRTPALALTLIQGQDRAPTESSFQKQEVGEMNSAILHRRFLELAQMVSDTMVSDTTRNLYPSEVHITEEFGSMQPRIPFPQSNEIKRTPNHQQFTTTLHVSRGQLLQCLDRCRCRCHFSSFSRSSPALFKYIGQIFLGYSSLPWCFSSIVPCTEQTCRRSQSSRKQLRYCFPSWFLSSMLSF